MLVRSSLFFAPSYLPRCLARLHLLAQIEGVLLEMTDFDEKKAGLDLDGEQPKAGPYDAILHDPEMEGLTLYEKKALLINRELDSQCLP